MSKLPVREVREKDPLSPTTKALLGLIQGLLPAMTAVIGGLWIAYTYLDHQKEIQTQQAIQAEKDNRTRLIEARKPFADKQLALYIEAAQVVGKLVTLTPDDDEWKSVERRFWELYWSELTIVEDKGVEEAMVKFSKHLYDYTAVYKVLKGKESLTTVDKEENKRLLDNDALDLAYAIRKSIESEWNGGNLFTTGSPSPLSSK
jgi:hypothetical protein